VKNANATAKNAIAVNVIVANNKNVATLANAKMNENGKLMETEYIF